MNAGDSRCYLFKERKLKQITEDQTYVNFLYKSGQIKAEEMATHPRRHVLTNAVGLFPSISVDLKIIEYHGEGIFLCSDGLYNNVSDVDIENVLRTDQSSEQKVSSLINIANFNGGSDNISIALWESLDDKD
jgi:protein phosphatase